MTKSYNVGEPCRYETASDMLMPFLGLPSHLLQAIVKTCIQGILRAKADKSDFEKLARNIRLAWSVDEVLHQFARFIATIGFSKRANARLYCRLQ